MARHTARTRVQAIEDGHPAARRDSLAVEEPMEIRLIGADERRTVAITMRTPGNDFEVAAGFLFGEGVIGGKEEVASVTYCTDSGVEQEFNIVNVTVHGPLPRIPGMERPFLTTSACGVCGKESLEALKIRDRPVMPAGPEIAPEVVYSLPATLRSAQSVFESTGGLHAAGLFTPGGDLVAVREDVGRHNAVDKIVGWALLSGRLPLSDYLLMVSGRCGYEIMQKALAAGIPVVCAVSAPSSLAVDLAAEFGMTLVGFLRGRRFNVYAGGERVRL